MDGIRVAHLNFINAPGVTRKLREEAQAARELGLPIDFYVINDDLEDLDEDNLHFRKREASRFHSKLRFIHSILFERIDLVSPFLDPDAYDVIVIRFGKLFLGHMPTYRRYGGKIVTEHHTDEMAELLLKRTLGRRILAAVSLRRSRAALKLVGGIVAVTGEILEKELAKSGLKPAYIFTNGIGPVGSTAVSRTRYSREPLRLAFVAADFQSWQGLDRLLEGLAAYRGETPIELHLAGRLDRGQVDAIERLPSDRGITIVRHGLVPAAETRRICDLAHLGIAGLALSRNGLREACPLKVREYAAQGLPFVYAFDDPDFPADWPYALRLPNEPEAIDVEAIVAFADELYSRGDPSEAIHSWAKERLEWRVKLGDLYAFLSTVAARRVVVGTGNS
jgi:hypothetical protein